MNIIISYQSDKPMYVQIKDGIKQAIFNGEFKNNDMLPSVRQLAKDLNVSMITTKRAYVDLEHEGFLYTISGKGTFVKLNDLSEMQSARQEEELEAFSKNVRELKQIGIIKNRLNSIIDEIYGGIDNE